MNMYENVLKSENNNNKYKRKQYMNLLLWI